MTKQVEINGNLYNTYATVDEADSYFAATFGSEWDNVGQTQKPQLLVTATRLIDKKDFQGVKVDENQPLKLPRVLADGTITDDNLNSNSTKDSTNSNINSGIKLFFGMFYHNTTCKFREINIHCNHNEVPPGNRLQDKALLLALIES